MRECSTSGATGHATSVASCFPVHPSVEWPNSSLRPRLRRRGQQLPHQAFPARTWRAAKRQETHPDRHLGDGHFTPPDAPPISRSPSVQINFDCCFQYSTDDFCCARADLQPRNSREFCTALRLLLALRRGNPPPVAETRISEGAPNSQRKDNPTCEPSPTTQPTM